MNDIRLVPKRKKEEGEPRLVRRSVDGIIAAKQEQTADVRSESESNFVRRRLEELELDLLKPFLRGRKKFAIADKKRSRFFQKKVFVLTPGLRTTFAAVTVAAAVIVVMMVGPGVWERGSQLKGEILANAYSAYGHLESAQAAMNEKNIAYAQAEFGNATESFDQISGMLGDWGGFFVGLGKLAPLGKVTPLGQVSDGILLLESGQEISEAGYLLTSGAEPLLTEEADLFGLFNPDKESSPAEVDTFFAALDSVAEARVKLESANEKIQKVDASSFPEVKDSIRKAQAELPTMLNWLSDFSDLKEVAEAILGRDGPRRYLVVFQNNTELRLTGGFVGSYAIVDSDKGQVKSLFVDDIYNRDGQLSHDFVAPVLFRDIGLSLNLRDANAFADFADSAQKISWFYEQAGGETIDGVIAVTPRVIQDLLEITGPIELEDYDVTFDSENLMLELDREIEEARKESDQPKTVMKELVPVFMEKLGQNKEGWPKLLGIFGDSLVEKDILFYFEDPDLESVIDERGWGGRIKETEGDYLGLYSANVGFNKTDSFVSQRVTKDVYIEEDGSAVSEVSIRRHFADVSVLLAEYPFLRNDSESIVKLFLPPGSEILEVSGIEPGILDSQRRSKMTSREETIDPDVQQIDNTMMVSRDRNYVLTEEHGKTVLSTWLIVDPGRTKEIKVKYRLPFKIGKSFWGGDAANYTLLVQKQPGGHDTDFYLNVHLPESWEVKWRHPEGDDGKDAGLLHEEFNLTRDWFFGAALGRSW